MARRRRRLSRRGQRRGGGTLVFDGDCGFCTTAAGWAGRVAPGTAAVPWQHADLPALGLDPATAAAAVQYVDGTGRVREGAEAVAGLLADGRAGWRPLGWLLALPGGRRAAAAAYGLVAANRYRLPGGTPACRVAAETGGPQRRTRA